MLNIQGLMKQAQAMQKKMQEAQEKLAETEVNGTSGNGMVSVILNGKSEMKKITIDKSLVNADDTEFWLHTMRLMQRLKLWPKRG